MSGFEISTSELENRTMADIIAERKDNEIKSLAINLGVGIGLTIIIIVLIQRNLKKNKHEVDKSREK